MTDEESSSKSTNPKEWKDTLSKVSDYLRAQYTNRNYEYVSYPLRFENEGRVTTIGVENE